MKKLIKINRIAILPLLVLGTFSNVLRAQDDGKSPLVVNLSYNVVNNQMPYLLVTAKAKVSGKFQPVKGATVKLFLDKDSTGKGVGVIGTIVTNEKGKGGIDIPPALAQQWKTSPNHTFVAVTDKTSQFDATSNEISTAMTKLTIDTAEDKNVVAVLSEYKAGGWVPVKGVDIKLAIKRMGGDLQIGDDQSYTTDSLGQAKGEFKKLKMPGDAAGNIVLVAKVEDNDQYGNLRVEKSMPWGEKFVPTTDFYHRALWASRFHSPLWLLIMAYSSIIAVWGTLIYLVFLLIKIKKLGKEHKSLS